MCTIPLLGQENNFCSTTMTAKVKKGPLSLSLVTLSSESKFQTMCLIGGAGLNSFTLFLRKARNTNTLRLFNLLEKEAYYVFH